MESGWMNGWGYNGQQVLDGAGNREGWMGCWMGDDRDMK